LCLFHKLVRNYELDRSQITLNEIIGIGQFGDVHIGTCRIKKRHNTSQNLFNNKDTKDDLNLSDGNLSSDSGSIGTTNTLCGDNKTGLIHVAVKTCKTDADSITTEKFLEEACN